MSEEELSPLQQYDRNAARIEELRTKIGMTAAIQGQQELIRDMEVQLERQLEPAPANLGERLLRQMRDQPRVDPGARQIGFNLMRTPDLSKMNRVN